MFRPLSAEIFFELCNFTQLTFPRQTKMQNDDSQGRKIDFVTFYARPRFSHFTTFLFEVSSIRIPSLGWILYLSLQ